MDQEKSWLGRNWQKLLAASFWVAAVAAYVAYTKHHNLTLLESLKQMLNFVQSSSAGPAIFILLYTLRPVFLFSALVLSIGGGALFGPFWGIVYTVIGANLGASLAYFIGRFFGDGMIDTSQTDSAFGSYINKMKENSFETIFFMRLIFLPYDLVNYLAGILKINFFAFLSATALGSIPGTISFVLAGASSGLDSGAPSFDPKVLGISVVLFIVSVGISKAMKKKQAKEQAV